jgi:hypothetical protein
MSAHTPGLREVSKFLKDVQGMRCNCDLDNWQPEQSTGHSRVCRIHKAATTAYAVILSKVATAAAVDPGEIAYQLTKRLVIDMPTARAAVDAALSQIAGSAS